MLANIKRKILWEVYMFFQKRGYNIVKREQYAFQDQKAFFATDKAITIFDVGANHGETAMEYLQNFPKSTVYAFEPLPNLYDYLDSRFRNNQQVKPQKIALSDSNGEAVFHVNGSQDTSSLLASKSLDSLPQSYAEVLKTTSQITVKTQTIDNFCQANKISHIDILKLDVQGAELKVLEGAKEMLQTGNIKLIYTEVIFLPTYEQQVVFNDLVAFMQKNRYKLHFFYNVGFNGTTGRISQCDCIFVQEDFFASKPIEVTFKP